MRVPASTYRLQITAASRCTTPPRRCPTSTTSASTGSTSRRCCRPSPAATTGTTSSTTPLVDPARGGPDGAGGALGRGAAAGDGRARRHRAEPHGRRDCRARTRGGGTCSPTAASRAYADAFDVDWDAGGGRVLLPVSATTTPRGGPGRPRRWCRALPRPRLPARPWHDARVEEQHYELVALAPGRRRAQLPAVLLGHHPGRDPRRGPSVFDESHARSGAGSTRGSSTGCGRPPRRPARPRGVPRRPARADRRRLRAGREDPGAGGGAAGLVGDRRHHRVRRARAGRPGAHRSRRAGAPDRAGDPPARRAAGLARAGPRHASAPSPTGSWLEVRRAGPRGRGLDKLDRRRRPAPVERDFGDPTTGLVDALAELLACFPVYRSYLPDGREHLDAAFAEARTASARPGARRFDALEPVLGDPAHRPPCASSRPAAR